MSHVSFYENIFENLDYAILKSESFNYTFSDPCRFFVMFCLSYRLIDKPDIYVIL